MQLSVSPLKPVRPIPRARTTTLTHAPDVSEKLYDLAGALGFLSTAFVSLYAPYLRERVVHANPKAYFPPLASHAPRQLLLTGALVLWASRLGSFLVTRVFSTGKDSRFDEIKRQPLAFTGMWLGQGAPQWFSRRDLSVLSSLLNF